LRETIKKERKVFAQALHDDTSSKIHALSLCWTKSEVCDSSITAHFVVYEGKMMGISVAHTICATPDIPPDFVHACPNLDVSIWSGCPPSQVKLLNITARVASAKIGDSATAFGYFDGQHRAWQGYITKLLGRNVSGRHFAPHPFQHAEELMYAAASQAGGMSGGGVVNGNGKISVSLHFNLMCRLCLCSLMFYM
jgi:hypothetical protein